MALFGKNAFWRRRPRAERAERKAADLRSRAEGDFKQTVRLYRELQEIENEISKLEEIEENWKMESQSAHPAWNYQKISAQHYQKLVDLEKRRTKKFYEWLAARDRNAGFFSDDNQLLVKARKLDAKAKRLRSKDKK